MVSIRPMNNIKLRGSVRVWSRPEVKVEKVPKATSAAVFMCMARKTKVLCLSHGASGGRVGLVPAWTSSRF